MLLEARGQSKDDAEVVKEESRAPLTPQAVPQSGAVSTGVNSARQPTWKGGHEREET